MTPVVAQQYVQADSAAYHGYWGLDFTRVDPHLGSNADFAAFVECAHSLRMKVYLDVVVNHTADVIIPAGGSTFRGADEVPYRDCKGKPFSALRYAGTNRFPCLSSRYQPRQPLVLPQNRSLKKPAWLNDVTRYHNRGDITFDSCSPACFEQGDFFGLDDIFTEQPFVVNGLARVFGDWIRQFRVDGFRVDTAKHVDRAFFERWAPKILATARTAGVSDFEIFGEVFTTDTVELSSFVRDRAIPNVIDFPLQDSLVRYAGAALPDRAASRRGSPTTTTSGGCWVSRRRPRPSSATTTSGRAAAKIREQTQAEGSELVARVNLGHSLLFLLRGAPTVDDGDEVGMMGRGGDKAARQDMFPTKVAEWQAEERVGSPPIGTGSAFDVVGNPIAAHLRELGALREKNPALSTGASIVRVAQQGVLAVSRIDRDARREYLAVFNASEAPARVTVQTATPSTPWEALLGSAPGATSGADGRVSVTVPPLDGDPAACRRRPAQAQRHEGDAQDQAGRDQLAPPCLGQGIDARPACRHVRGQARRAKGVAQARRGRLGAVRRLHRPAQVPQSRAHLARGRDSRERRLDQDVVCPLGHSSLMATAPDVTTALDGSGRRFAFRPAAITGNGSVLVTISERGEVERIFWPNVDHGQHLGELRLGLERQDEMLWLDDAPCSWEQTYLDGSSVLRTTAEIAGATVEISDLVTPAEPVIARGIRSTAAERLIVRIAPSLDGDDRSGAGYVDPGSGALVFYLRDVALAVQLVAVDATTTLQESNGLEPTHDIVVHRAPVEGALTGDLANEALLLVAFGATPDEAIARLRRPAAVGFDVLAAERMAYDRETVALAAPASDEGAVGELYARSLLVLEQLTDRQTGATIAAPEFDPSFEQSGGYGFVWPRDLGYVVLSFLAAGRGDLAVPALRWLARGAGARGTLAPALLDRRLARAQLGSPSARRDRHGSLRVRGRVAGARRCGARPRALAVGSNSGGLPVRLHGRGDGLAASERRPLGADRRPALL